MILSSTVDVCSQRLAAMNCEKIHAVGGLMAQACVKYARKAVPDRMTGS